MPPKKSEGSLEKYQQKLNIALRPTSLESVIEIKDQNTREEDLESDRRTFM
jgi:hypothetical protein